MKPYQPSNKVPSAGIIWLVLTSVVAGVAIGGLTSFIARLIYLIVLFPIGMGFAGGVATGAAVQRGKVRNPLVGGAFGALTGLIIYGALNYGNYLAFKQDVTGEINQELSKGSGEVHEITLEPLVDEFLKSETGTAGFWGYMKYQAKQGVELRWRGAGITFNEPMTWTYWLIELAVIDAIVLLLASGAALDPFCEACNRWYGDQKRVGNVNIDSHEPFVNLLNDQNFSQAGELIEEGELNPPRLDVYLRHCPCCQLSDALLTVNRACENEKGELEHQQLLEGMISVSQQHQLVPSFDIKKEAHKTPKST